MWRVLYLQNIVMLACDWLAGHLWKHSLAGAGNGINGVQNRSHDRGKLPESRAALRITHDFSTQTSWLAFFVLRAALWWTTCIQIRSAKLQVCLWLGSRLITTLPQHHPDLSTVCLRQEPAHLLVSPRQQHTGVLAKSLISIFYEGTQRQPLEYLPCKSTAYYINYSVGK